MLNNFSNYFTVIGFIISSISLGIYLVSQWLSSYLPRLLGV